MDSTCASAAPTRSKCSLSLCSLKKKQKRYSLSVLNKNGHHFFMPLNIKQIKNHGFQLGLEAELNLQMRQYKAAVEDKKWAMAMQSCKNMGELLSELTYIGEVTQLASHLEDKPCEL